MAVSRILSRRVAPAWTVISLGDREIPARLAAGATLPGVPFGHMDRTSKPAASSPVLSCTAWGFSCPLGYPRGGGLLPRLFTLTRGQSLLRRLSSGGLFSVTLSVARDFHPGLPRVLRGMPPYGVRTFLRDCSRRPSAVTRLGIRHAVRRCKRIGTDKRVGARWKLFPIVLG